MLHGIRKLTLKYNDDDKQVNSYYFETALTP